MLQSLFMITENKDWLCVLYC